MNLLKRFWGILLYTAKRISAQKGLTLAIIFGFTVAASLTMSIPIYADAANQKILETDVLSESSETGASTPTSSFAFMFRYVGSWFGKVGWEKVQPVDTYLSEQGIIDLDLPLQQLVRFFRTDSFPFVSADTEIYSGSEYFPLAWVSIATLTSWDEHVEVVEGAPPASASPARTGETNIWVSEELASEIGLQAGESYRLLAKFDDDKRDVVITAHIAGIWAITELDDPYWFYKPADFRYVVFTTDQDFFQSILPVINNEIDLALWYMLMDKTAVHSSDVPSLVNRISKTRTRAGVYLPHTQLDVSPEEKLRNYQKASSALRLFLFILDIPILGMLMAFISLIGSMVVSQRLNEIAVLRSRGASIFQVFGFSIFEGTLIGLVSLLAASFLSVKLALFFGRVNSFLDFSAVSSIKPSLSLDSLQLGIATIALGMGAMLIPTLSASRHTIITYKQETARQLRLPWWQRAWLDIWLLIPTLYGIYLLRKQGGLNIPLTNGMVSQDPFQNPLLVVVPALGIFSMTLLLLRLLPWVMAALARLLSLTSSIGALAAARHLARTTGNFHAPIILLVLTLSLSTYTATLAQTLDRHSNDQIFYNIGADVNLLEFGEMPGGSSAQIGNSTNEEQYWVFLPVTEHLKATGVLSAARVAKEEISVLPPLGAVNGVLMGIDRVDFQKTAFWRSDFASVPLGELMNQLALTTEGVLVPRDFLETNKLKPGDDLKASLYKLGSKVEFSFKIVGAFDLFPTWYPDEGPLLVVNLDYIFEQVGGEFPYNVLLDTSPGADSRLLLDDLDRLGLRVSFAQISQKSLEVEKSRPERQGLFGLLSVGFSALALLTTLGFLLYAFFSFRRRFIELGILRAIGLSSIQMIVLLGIELAFLLGLGILAGTALGVGVSNLFIPYLQVGTAQTAQIPPFLVQIDWSSVTNIYILFVLLFAFALGILAVLLFRMKIFQAIKLGETI